MTHLATIIRKCPYDGDVTVLGVFENMDAALERLRLFTTCTDSGEEYHIEMHDLVTLKDQKKRTADIMRSRARYKAANAAK